MAGRTADDFYLTVFIGASAANYEVDSKFASLTNYLPCMHRNHVRPKHFYLTAKSGATGFSLLP